MRMAPAAGRSWAGAGTDESSGATGRPWVVVSVGMSVDGRVTLGRKRLLLDEDAAQVWRSLSRPSAQALDEARSALLDRLYQPQVILEGSGLLVPDSAGSVTGLGAFEGPVDVLYDDFLPAEVVERPGHAIWFAVVDSRGRVKWQTKSQDEFDVVVLVARKTPAEYLAYLRREQICYLVVGEERVDLSVALQRLRDRLGVSCVVSTAGGGLNGALLRAGLVDELQLLVLPAAVGGLGTPTLFDGPELAAGESPTRLRLLFAHAETDGMLWLRYEVLHEIAAS